MTITPLEYHLIGLAMVAIAFLVGRFGPQETRGWPSGIRSTGGRAALLAFMAIAWPPFAFVYAFGAVFFVLQWGAALGFWGRAVQSVFAIVGFGMAIGAVYWLFFVALPFLAHWYGFVAA